VRAYGANVPPKAGLEHAAVVRPKRLFGAARAVEDGGSLTVVAIVNDGTPADAALVAEFAPMANAEWVLSRELSDARAYPPLDLVRSGNVYEDALVSEIASRKLGELRRALAGVPALEASERVYAVLAKSATNDAFVTSAGLAKI
jgi:transcription termination factor Rho